MTYLTKNFSFNDDIHDCEPCRCFEPNNCYLLMKPDRFKREIEESNQEARDAGWVNPTDIPPILYDEERKCRIVTRVKENEQHE